MTEIVQVIGYRKLSDDEVTSMNAIKIAGNSLGALIDSFEKDPRFDQRWLAIGKTQIQQGLMAVTRAIAKPTSF
jgi:hypothetical protein